MSPKKMIGLSFAAAAAKLYEVFDKMWRKRNAFPPLSCQKVILFDSVRRSALIKILGVIEHLALGVGIEHDLLRRAVVENAQGIVPRAHIFRA